MVQSLKTGGWGNIVNGGTECVSEMSLPSATLWTVAHQASLSMGFPGQEYLRGLPCPPPGDLPVPGIQTHICIAGGFFTTEPPRKPICFAKPH